jgi:hypothetical protein
MMILPLILAASVITPSPIASPTALPSPTSTSEIQKFREIIQEKVKAKLQEISQTKETNPKRGYVGTITKINQDTINLDTKDTNRTINFTTDTVYLNAKSTKIKHADLKIGQEVLVIGLLDDQKNLTAKRIIITTPKSIQNQKTIILGQVVDISTMYSLIAMIPTSNKNTQYQIKADTKNLQILSKNGDKLTLKDIKKGQKIIVISITAPSPSQTLTVEKIIVM